MSGWLILAAYVAAFLVTYRYAYRTILDHEDRTSTYRRDPDGEDRAMVAVISLLIAMMAPVALVGYAIYRVATPKTASDRRAEVEELEQRKRDLQDDVARMERELGIRDRE